MVAEGVVPDRQAGGRDVVPIFLRVDREQVAYVKFIFESYEDVAVVRTLDSTTAILVVLAVPDFVSQARVIAASLVAEGVCAETATPAGGETDLLGPDVEAGEPCQSGDGAGVASIAGDGRATSQATPTETR